MAHTTISVGQFSNGKIQIEPTQVRVSNGTIHPSLTIPAEIAFRKVERPSVPQFALVGVQASLSGSPRGSNKFADSTAILDPLDVTNEREVSKTFELEFSLDPYRIRLIEAYRRVNIIFSLKFQLLIAHYEPIFIQKGGRQEQQNFVAYYSRPQQDPELRLEIPQAHWVSQILPAFGLGEYFLIEIPKGRKTVSAAWDYLEKAETAFRNWNSKEVYANCRELGSLLDQSMKDKFGVNDFSYSIRWKKAYSGFAELASWSLHLEDIKKSPKYSPDDVQTNKADAEHVLLRTKELLKYAEEILET